MENVTDMIRFVTNYGYLSLKVLKTGANEIYL